jgi:hypothetical protein
VKDARYFFFNKINFRLLVNQNSDIILSLWNAIFERIISSISFWLEISDRKLNESEFFNCI